MRYEYAAGCRAADVLGPEALSVQLEGGVPVKELCRKHEFSDVSF